jgi:N-acetyl-anhydromuramyl-L-alanine amidase AmpD
MPTYRAPEPRMIAARWKGGSQTPRDIVLHSMVYPCKAGAADWCGHFFATEDNKTSAHYGVDPTEVVQYVGDHTVAYHCGHNQDSIGIEMADMSGVYALRWLDKEHRAMLRLAARLVAELCLAYDIPPYYVSAWGLLKGKHGVTTHAQETKAFHQSTHTDPGWWPRRKFMRMVRAEVAAIKAEAGK